MWQLEKLKCRVARAGEVCNEAITHEGVLEKHRVSMVWYHLVSFKLPFYGNLTKVLNGSNSIMYRNITGNKQSSLLYFEKHKKVAIPFTFKVFFMMLVKIRYCLHKVLLYCKI